MSFGWPDLLRSIVDGKYFLKQFLEEEEADTGLFLADGPDGSLADVRLTPSGDAIRRIWSERAALSTTLTHPHLLRDIEAGETRIDGNNYSYLASEHIEERLADVVESRTLTPEETRTVVEASVTALDHLHKRGYMHGKLMPSSIVAAGDAVKLVTSTVRPLPGDELESRRAVTADLRELAETATQMLTGKREPGAGVHLPSPFREFVRASFGTEECPSPTAAQLLGVLHGEPLSAPKRVPPESVSNPPAPQPIPIELPPVTQDVQPVRFRPGPATVLLASLVVLAIVFAAYRLIGVAADRNDPPVRGRATDIPEPRPSLGPPPAATPKAAPPQRPAGALPSGLLGRWAVVAAAYSDYDAAARRMKRLNARWKEGNMTVFPAKGQGSRYFVVVGSATSQRDAERLRAVALSSGMPPDTYVTRLQF